MAITYTLTLSSPLTADEVAQELLTIAQEQDLLDTSVPADDLTRDGKATIHGTWLKVVDEDLSEDDPVADLGIRPAVSVFFRYKKEGYETQDDDLTKMVASLLKRFAEDAVLHFEYDSIWLLRRNGELLVNDTTEEWTPSRLALLPESFGRATLKFPSD
ncbi:MAG: hypothetical protein JO362_15315 [Streptomycetaceae bacterium]|nr:hypothetical protein [Streptomycetaceae bacterium]